ncbi:InlB B-repeat-containing protein [Alkaliphilus transvaalensis]|uniref:InlB B-repeat-containing protein n=1 Tax=Alkaliphilus transvaalensis TaxID=114628 RepID=UPI000555DFE8|nr:prepilin-type N-terminal cleavage/methylation domain-containing protein [Alkaliphilus transvaalensis]
MMKSNFKRMKNTGGFTLIEVVVVIAILGVLSAIAVPRLGGFNGSAEHKTNLANAKILTNAAHMIEATLGYFPTEEYWGSTFTEIEPVKVDHLINDKIIFLGNGSFKYDATTGVVSIDGGSGGTDPDSGSPTDPGGEIPNTYQLTVTVNATSGGTASGTGTYEEGQIVNVSANAKSGYQFINWQASAGTFDDIDAPSTTFIMPSQNVTVTANFEPIPSAENFIKSINGSGNFFKITFKDKIITSTSNQSITVTGLGTNEITYRLNSGSFTINAEVEVTVVTESGGSYSLRVRRNGNSHNWRILTISP